MPQVFPKAVNRNFPNTESENGPVYGGYCIELEDREPGAEKNLKAIP